MDNLTPVYITNIIESGTAFGLREDTGEQVFVPSSVSRAAALQTGDTVECKLLPNSVQPEKTPWFAVRAGEQPEQVEEQLSVWDVVKDGGVWTLSKVFQEMYEGHVDVTSTEYKDINTELHRLHRAGDLSAAKLYRAGDQDKASIMYFSANYNELLPAA